MAYDGCFHTAGLKHTCRLGTLITQCNRVVEYAMLLGPLNMQCSPGGGRIKHAKRAMQTGGRANNAKGDRAAQLKCGFPYTADSWLPGLGIASDHTLQIRFHKHGSVQESQKLQLQPVLLMSLSKAQDCHQAQPRSAHVSTLEAVLHS